MSPRTVLLIALLVAAGPLAPAAGAQGVLPPAVDQSGVSYHRFLRSGEVEVEVLVLGDVRNPGVYVVGLEMGPDELLALVGGPTGGSRSENVETDVTVQIFREETTGRTLVYEEPMAQFLAQPPPPLREGDAFVVDVVERREPRTLDTVLRVVTAASTVFLLIERLSRL